MSNNKKMSTIESFIVYLFIFVSFAFPKAGVTYHGVSITFQMVLLICAIGFSITYIIKTMSSYFKKIYFLYFSLLFIILLINLSTMDLFVFFCTMVLIFSPLTAFVSFGLKYSKFAKIVSISLIIVGGFAIIQNLFGIEATRIDGLTATVGTSYSDKSIGYNPYTDTAIKMPSTYQNGNESGVFCCLGSCFLVNYLATRKVSLHQSVFYIFSIVLGIVGLFLCGSRSVLYSLIISLLIIVIFFLFSRFQVEKYKKERKIVTGLFGVGLLVFLCFLFFNNEYLVNFYSVYVLRTMSDPTGSGRVTQFLSLIQLYFKEPSFSIMTKEVLFGFPWTSSIQGEGFYLLLSKYGAIFMLVFYAFLLICSFKLMKKTPFLFVGLLSTIIVFVVDSSYNYLPTLCLFFLFWGAEENLFILAKKKRVYCAVYLLDCSLAKSKNDSLHSFN